MTTFFLPLGVKSKWEDNELRYLLRSLETNFTDEFKVVIYAQKKPDWLINVECLEIPRYYPDNALRLNRGVKAYENYFDTLNKLKTFVYSESCDGGFVYIYDDILLIKKIDAWGILNYPQNVFNDKHFIHNLSSKHGRTINTAFNTSGSKYNFETHLPKYYYAENMRTMFEKYPFDKLNIPYAIATTYFGLYLFQATLPPLQEKNDYKAGFEGFSGRVGVYPQDIIEQINEAVEGKTWVNYNDVGLWWNTEKYNGFLLQDWIKNKFPNKSKFEI